MIERANFPILAGIDTYIGLSKVDYSMPYYERILASFFKHSAYYQTELEQASITADYPRLRATIHRLYGVAANIGAERLAGACWAFLEAPETGQFDTELHALYESVTQALHQVVVGLDDFFEPQRAPEGGEQSMMQNYPVLAGKQVVLVEDEPTLTEIMCMALQSQRMVVISLASKDAALAWLRQNPHVIPDVLVSDIRLSDGNGVDLAWQFRLRAPALSVLLISGTALEQDLPLDTRYGFLRKPFSFSRLTATLAELMV